MERKTGMLKLPPGFRFHPTDEELVVQYLKRKVFNCPLPSSIIRDINLAKFDPWDLPGGCEEERYFFNLKEAKYPTGSRSNRAAGSGCWKATGKEKPIKSASSSQVVGMKQVFVFFRGKPATGTKTDWVMHEYRLAGAETPACVLPHRKHSTQSCTVPSGDWVLCRIFKKKRATNVEADTAGDDTITCDRIQFIDFMGERGERYGSHQPSTCLSDSSCLTESSDGSSDEEESNSRRSPLA
ncbi:NAC domain-containing protein 83-like [Curcuma longa]|uniref:NAC domain-containing protein 83-like n=1 Tax=Curcuma longa TaxID=136217 RepID=UPI003D9E08E3